jgi:hypothetical protein
LEQESPAPPHRAFYLPVPQAIEARVIAPERRTAVRCHEKAF